jgi:hypothetical protein
VIPNIISQKLKHPAPLHQNPSEHRMIPNANDQEHGENEKVSRRTNRYHLVVIFAGYIHTGSNASFVIADSIGQSTLEPGEDSHPVPRS